MRDKFMKNTGLSARPSERNKLIAKSHRWQKHALAVAAALVMGLCALQAQALSLGRISVLSPLGAPLLAEIEILDINAEEAATLQAKAASPESFKAAGLEFNPALLGLTITLEKRPDDRSYFRIRSDRAINDPFVDLMLEARWGSGRIVRDYTLLFDPPNSRPNQVSIQSMPQLSSVPAQIKAPEVLPSPNGAVSSPNRTSRPPELPRTPIKKPTPAPDKPAESGKTVTVKPGDTAGRIAATLINPSISLEQMLVAMLRANPDAFVAGNVNRIRAGAVLNIPGEENVQATPAREAKQMILTQSQDFNEFRNKLAANAPVTTVTAADRQASGTVQSKVDDKKTSATAPDKLTLSQGSVSSKNSEVAIAKDRQTKEANKKSEEISKTISDLNKLAAATAPAAVAPTPPAPAPAPASATVPKEAPAPVLTTNAPAVTAAVAPNVVANVPSIEASSPQPMISAPVKKVAVPAPAPAPESSLIDDLLDDPLVPAAAGGLIALLAGLGFYRHKKRKASSEPINSEFTESRIQPDSFFGASGGQQVDTQDSALAGSSMLYTPSQLESADDVDPVAEADVYLAYGRDIQAEEILKEALRMHPDRVAVHQKLLEIYAKRRDLKSFESIAKQAIKVSGGESQEWGRISELGRSIDPANELYQAIGQMFSEPELHAPTSAPDLDLDLDFSLDNPPSVHPSAEVESFEQNTSTPTQESAPPALDVDFDFKLPEPPVAPIQSHIPDSSRASIQNLAFDATEVNELAYQASASQGMETASHVSVPTAPAPLSSSTVHETKAENDGLLEFDLGSLSLDLGPTTEQTPKDEEDPLGTKLALATEFGSIGDLDGARNLIEEVIAEASGEMKAKAQLALSQLR